MARKVVSAKSKTKSKAKSKAKSSRRKIIPANTPTQESSRQVRVRTAEEVGKEQTAEQLALRIWAAIVGEQVLKDMSALMDALLESHLLDDDDEEADEGWLDDQHKREKNLLDEAIAGGSTNIPISPPSTICRTILIRALRATQSS
jgi:hypothetical protein